VPLAAYVARNLSDITFPFARFQMDMVFRGERPKKGRYRSFRQCDFDVIGRGKLSLLYDAQMPALIVDLFQKLNIGSFLVRISNRKVLAGFFASLGIDVELIRACVKIVDQAEKVSREQTQAALIALGLTDSMAERIQEFCALKGTPEIVLDALCKLEIDNDEFLQGVSELEQVAQGLVSLKVDTSSYCFDMAIARGLGYYTGTVYETVLVGQEDLGTICAGGRYEGLVGIFARESMPGVGISIGWTRLFVNLVERGILTPTTSTPAQVAVLCVDPQLIGDYLAIASELRSNGIAALSTFEARAIGKQFGWADKLGVPVCVVVGSDEITQGVVGLKDLRSGKQIQVQRSQLVQAVNELFLGIPFTDENVTS
jgi:histidyl-tRNA synthetase